MRHFILNMTNLLIFIDFYLRHMFATPNEFRKNCVDVLHKNDLLWFFLPGVKKFGIDVAYRVCITSKPNHSRGDPEFDQTHLHPTTNGGRPKERSAPPLLNITVKHYC
jgi:hypothetical protein